MSYYPDGMTRRDWERLDGLLHFRECLAHEDAPYKRGAACVCEELADAARDAAAEAEWGETRDEGGA